MTNEILARAAQVYGLSLTEMLHSALLIYRRRPGLGDLVRIHESTVGRPAYLALIHALEASTVERFYPSPGCLQLREELHWHIQRCLRTALVRDGYASGAIRDLAFGADLGL